MTKRAELVKILDLVGHALATHDLVPMFKCFCFDSEKVTAYSDAIAITYPSGEEDDFALNGATLLGLLKNSHAEDVNFSVKDKQDVSIKTGKSHFKMPYFTKDEFLFEPPAGPWLSKITIDDNFIKGLAACMQTSSTDLAQPAWLGVHVREHSKGISYYSTDGDAVTRFQTTGKFASTAPCLLPNIFCEALIKLRKESDCREDGTLSLNEEWARAQLDSGFTIYGRLIKVDEAVDFEQEIKSTLKGKPDFVPVPKELDHALSRARVIADPESAKTVLEIAGGKLKLSTETQMGLVTDTLACKHPDVLAEVSAAMVQRAIGLCNEIAILEGCTVYKDGTELFMLVGNMG